jgi:23S rRNA (uracil1939-C5)-methyltransferase
MKQEQLKDALLRESPEDIAALAPAIASGAEFHYRNKVCFHVHRVGNLLDVGYVKSDNVSVFDVDKCLLLNEKIQSQYDEIRSNISVMHSLRDGMELTIRYSSGKDEVTFWRNSPDKRASWLKEKLSCGMFSVPLGNFFQVNNEIADKLLETATACVAESKAQQLRDLYCGAGFFSFGCAAKCLNIKQIYGVEIEEASIECAKFNLKSFENIQSSFFAGDSAKKLPDILKKLHSDTCVIIDPPRNGLDAKLPAMLGKTEAVKSIVYISCNLATWARDLHRLKKYGFKLQKVQGFNMFPRTGHFEIFSYWTK